MPSGEEGTIEASDLHERRELAGLAVRLSDLRGLPLAFDFGGGAIGTFWKCSNCDVRDYRAIQSSEMESRCGWLKNSPRED